MGSYAFDKQHTRQLHVKLNARTDADILSRIESESNIQGYIKKLIRADIAAQAAGAGARNAACKEVGKNEGHREAD